MMSNRVRVWVLFLTLIALSRFWALGRIPPGLNRDEAAIGYNAYSVLKTGRDEYGKPFPLQLKSFGDWKLPLYPYLAIPFIHVLGLNQLAIRLPSAFFGLATVAILPILTAALLGKFKLVSSPGEAWAVGMIAGVTLAFSPWQFHFSHLASEANLAVFLFSGGFWLFLRSLEKPGWFWWGAVFLLLTLLAYHGAHVFMPPFFLLLLITFAREMRKMPSRWGRLGLGLTMAAAVVFVGVFSFHSDRAKLAGLFILDQKSRLHVEIDLPRSAHRNHFIGRLLHNKLTFLSRELPLNLAETFSPQFLLRSGGRNRAHNVPGFGNFLISAAVLAAVGVLVSFRLEPRLFAFLAAWSLLAALPSAITFDSPHTTRAAFLVIPLSLFSGIGGWWIWRRKNVLMSRILAALLVLWFAGEMALFLENYWQHFPAAAAGIWNAGYRELSQEIKTQGAGYERVVLTAPERSPYIFLLFYLRYPPDRFQKEAVRFPPTSEGFEHVRSFGRYEFVKEISPATLKPGRLYVVPAGQYWGGEGGHQQLAKISSYGQAEFFLVALPEEGRR